MSRKFEFLDLADRMGDSDKCQTSRLTGITALRVYVNQAIPTQVAALIRAATTDVRMCFYKFHPTSVGGALIVQSLTALREKAIAESRPITVKILLNMRGGIAEKVYKPNDQKDFQPLLDLNVPGVFTVTVSHHKAQAFDTYHAKMLVVDADQPTGTVVFCGGDIQLANDPIKQQYETAAFVAGREISGIAADDFDRSLVERPDYRPREIGDVELSTTTTSEMMPTLYMSSKAHPNPLTELGIAPYKIALIQSISTASSRIDILTANINDRDVCTALTAAANRGVRIRILIGKFHNDTAERFFGGTNLERLSEIEKNITPENKWCFQLRWVTNEAGDLVKHGERHTMHGKFCMIDDRLLFMGSSPLDKQAMQCSREIDICTRVPIVMAQDIVHRVFEKPYFERGRVYYVDQIIEMLSALSEQLQSMQSFPVKLSALKQAITELGRPNVTIEDALLILSSDFLNRICRENARLSAILDKCDQISRSERRVIGVAPGTVTGSAAFFTQRAACSDPRSHGRDASRSAVGDDGTPGESQSDVSTRPLDRR